MNQNQLTEYLWNNYQPNKIWIVLLGIGAGAAFLLFLYDRLLIRRNK